MQQLDPPHPWMRTAIDGVDVELFRGGSSQPLLFLHAVEGIHPDNAFFRRLVQHFDVIAPWHPGFGHSELPREFRTVDDLAYFYLTLADRLDLRNAVLAGVSFGGWIAAEIAIRSTARFSHLVLVDAYGIKVGDRETRDIADLFAISQDEITRLAFHAAGNRIRDYSQMPERDLIAIARSREAFAYFGWKPYLHNPGLRRWLRRIDIPALVLWGESDGIVSTEYGRAYAAEIPGSRFTVISEAGHYPHIEQPERVVEMITRFTRSDSAGEAPRIPASSGA
jgi:pimeloyl-ACP methyl ester carboxylesterase